MHDTVATPRALAMFAATATALALGGCGPSEAERDSSGTITASSDASVFSLKVGDCLDTAQLNETDENVESVPVVPCTEPHDGEIYAEKTMTGSDYPGKTKTQDEADEYCTAQFAAFIGVTFDESTLGLSTVIPTSDSWTGWDDRAIQCIVVSENEKVTDTMKGINK